MILCDYCSFTNKVSAIADETRHAVRHAHSVVNKGEGSVW